MRAPRRCSRRLIRGTKDHPAGSRRNPGGARTPSLASFGVPGTRAPTAFDGVASIIDRAIHRLTAAGVGEYVATADAIEVPASADDGFTVRLEVLGARDFLVRYDGWRHRFDRAEDAYDCFEYGLSDSCRLKVTFRGDEAVEWQVEKREYGMWAPGHAEGRTLVPFWRKRRVEYRQNRHFRAGVQ